MMESRLSVQLPFPASCRSPGFVDLDKLNVALQWQIINDFYNP
jgi:hypothetical protein